MATLSEDDLEALERTVNEIDALSAIYGEPSPEGEGSSGSRFRIVSKQELGTARSILLRGGFGGEAADLPTLEVEISANVELGDGTREEVKLTCRIPRGYPEKNHLIPSASSAGMPWSMRDELSAKLAESAEAMAGSESIMGLVAELGDLCPPIFQRMQLAFDEGGKSSAKSTEGPGIDEKPAGAGFARLWIWVHHVTDRERRKSIVAEARGLKLGGFLKRGYPGIIVVEGAAQSCGEFAVWVKGNKSRPGGFGRNWGHHVRGQVQVESESQLLLPSNFQEMEEMAAAGRLCKEKGLEEEFLEFAMGHSKAGM